MWSGFLVKRSIKYHQCSLSEYNDVYDEYSRSVEEESCISPRTGRVLFRYLMIVSDLFLPKTARQYLYGDDDALKESLEKVEEAEDEAENDGDADGEDLSLIGKLPFLPFRNF